MIRNIAMLGLMATFLTLGACDDLCGGCDAEAPSESSGAAVQVESCGECLEGCDDAAAMGDTGTTGLAADAAAAPMTCPVSGTSGEGVCGVVDKESCGMAGDCDAEAKADCETQCETEAQCETQCDETPAAPKVTD